jgi:hypothetical protein
MLNFSDGQRIQVVDNGLRIMWTECRDDQISTQGVVVTSLRQSDHDGLELRIFVWRNVNDSEDGREGHRRVSYFVGCCGQVPEQLLTTYFISEVKFLELCGEVAELLRAGAVSILDD